MKIGLVVASAMAALIAVVVWIGPHGSSRQTVVMTAPPLVLPVDHGSAPTTSDSADTTPDMTSVLAVSTEDESGVGFIPSAPDDNDGSVSFGFSVPSFPSAPSWDGTDATQSNSSTTQEAS